MVRRTGVECNWLPRNRGFGRNCRWKRAHLKKNNNKQKAKNTLSAKPLRLEAFSQTLEMEMGRPLPFEDLVERFLGIAEAGWVFGVRGLKFEAKDIRLYIYKCV